MFYQGQDGVQAKKNLKSEVFQQWGEMKKTQKPDSIFHSNSVAVHL